MTTHNRTSIDLTDITGLHFQCSNCGTALTIPIARVDSMLPSQCPNCHKRWGFQDHKSDITTASRIGGVVESIQSLAKELADQKAAGFTLSLEIYRALVDSN